MDQIEEQGTRASTFPASYEGIPSDQLARLELLFQKAPIGLCIIDRDLRYISINETLAAINGKSVEEHIGRSLNEAIPEITPILEPMLCRVIETGEPALSLEFKRPALINLHDPGCWLVSLYPFEDDGKVQAVGVMVQDVTNLKRAEAESLEGRHLIQTLVEGTKAVPWISDAKTGQFTYVGPQMVELLGYTVDQWYEKDFWSDHIHPEDRGFAIKYCKQSSRSLRDYEFDYRMIASDGKVVCIHDMVNVEWVDGEPKTLRGFMIDITGQKSAEERLKNSEERYRTLYENNPLMCFTTDSEGTVLYVNQLGAEQLGYTAEQLVGKSVLNVFYEDDKKTMLEQLSICLQNPAHIAHWELRKVHKDGRILWVRESARAIHEINGNKAILIACEDITERKEAEQALQKALFEIQQLKDQLQAENIYLKEEIKSEQNYGEIVGNSQAIRAVLGRAERVAKTDSTILVTGETGTGKELLARMIHNLSHRNSQAIVKVNCAAIPSSLIESELFGREKGAYTGALTKQIGRFELANGSTIFLDEIGELSVELQSKLLRVLQDGEFERLGSPKTINVDVRVVAATNKDLAKAVSEGRFREDLYYRLNVFPIHVPPLRERMDDIPNLVWKFVKEFSDKMGKRIESIPKKTMDSLISYPWPGNVRELRNVIERAMILARDNTLRVELPKTETLKNIKTMTIMESEKTHILHVLQMTGWRVRGKGGAAEVLALKPSTLESRMSKLGIVRNKQKPDIS